MSAIITSIRSPRLRDREPKTVMEERKDDSLFANGNKPDGVPARPIGNPTLPVHVDHVMHVTDDLELVVSVAFIPCFLQVFVEIWQAVRSACGTFRQER